jgi:hypothetical protein
LDINGMASLDIIKHQFENQRAFSLERCDTYSDSFPLPSSKVLFSPCQSHSQKQQAPQNPGRALPRELERKSLRQSEHQSMQNAE